MAYKLIDGRYQVPIIDFGKQLQGRGWNVAEHSAFGGVSDVHAPNSYHKYDEAIDITWKNNKYGDYDPSGKVKWDDWTDQLGKRLAGAGPEVLYRSNDPKHSTHVHLAAKNGVLNLTPEQMADFGFDVDGNVSSTSPASSTSTDTSSDRGGAKARAQAYSDMSKSQLDNAYDAMRNDPVKAKTEGMKMHNAFFNKPERVLG